MSQDKESITYEDVEAIMEYMDKKLIDGLPRADLAKKGSKAQSSANSASYLQKKGQKSIQ